MGVGDSDIKQVNLVCVIWLKAISKAFTQMGSLTPPMQCGLPFKTFDF